MLDLDFIQKEKYSLRGVLLYEYDSAVFKPQVINRIRDHFSDKGVQFRQIDYDNPIFSFNETSLFGEYLVLIDLDELGKDKQYKKHLAEMADYIEAKVINNKFLFILRKGSSKYETLKNLQSFIAIAKAATKINEVELSKTTFSKVFGYTCSTYKELVDLSQLENYKMFKTSVEEFVINEKPDLSEFLSKFDVFVFVAIDFKQNQFNSQFFRQLVSVQEKINFFKVHRLVFDFIIAPSKNTAAKLFKEVDNRVNKNSTPTKVIISILFRVTQDFSIVNSKLNPQKHLPGGMSNYKWKQLLIFESLPLNNLFRWQVLLAKYEAKFNTKNLLLVFQEFLEEFY